MAPVVGLSERVGENTVHMGLQWRLQRRCTMEILSRPMGFVFTLWLFLYFESWR